MAWTRFGQDGNLADLLREYIGYQGAVELIRGISAPGDGLGGLFVWLNGNYVDDGLNTFVPPNAVGIGGWLRADVTQLISGFVPPSSGVMLDSNGNPILDSNGNQILLAGTSVANGFLIDSNGNQILDSNGNPILAG